MTIATEVSSVSYQGNGEATRFDFPFRVFEAGDLDVYRTGADGVPVLLERGIHYSVSGVGANQGHIDYPLNGLPLPAGDRITLDRHMEIVQETSFSNQGAYLPEVVEQQFDKTIMLIQQVSARLSNTIGVPVGSDFWDAMFKVIRNLSDPSLPQDAANKRYVDGELTAETALWEAIKNAARDFASAASESADESAASALQSEAFSVEAASSARQSLAGAEASGDVKFYDTYAQADAVDHDEGQIIEVLRDETRYQYTSRYRYESGALAFKLYPRQLGGIGLPFWGHPSTMTQEMYDADPFRPNFNYASLGPLTLEEGLSITIPEGTSWEIFSGPEAQNG